MPAEAVADAGHAAMAGIGEVVGILVDIIIPVVLVLAGVFTYSWLGGAVAVSSLMQQAGLSPSLANHIGPLVPAAIAFSIGGGFWGALGSHKGLVLRAIGRAVGSYFLGVGGGYVLNAAFGNPTPGALDDLITSTSAAVVPGR